MTQPKFGPPDCPLTPQQWLRFLWLYGCCSGNKARAYLDTLQPHGNAFMPELLEAVQSLPEGLREKLAEEIGQRVVSNDRSLDPPGFRGPAGSKDKSHFSR